MVLLIIVVAIGYVNGTLDSAIDWFITGEVNHNATHPPSIKEKKRRLKHLIEAVIVSLLVKLLIGGVFCL